MKANAHYGRRLRSKRKKIERAMYWKEHWARKQTRKDMFTSVGYNGQGY